MLWELSVVEQRYRAVLEVPQDARPLGSLAMNRPRCRLIMPTAAEKRRMAGSDAAAGAGRLRLLPGGRAISLPAMADTGSVAWPPAPIRTQRLALRESEARDRAALIELSASPEVGTYLGGPRPRDELERAMPEVPGRRFGFFVVELDGAMIGMVTLDRRDAARPGHVRPDAGETELGYMFLPHAWGSGYAAEACAAALDWFAGALPGEPVVLCTQTANEGVDARRGEAGVHRGGAVRGVRRRAVVRRVVLGHAVRLSSCPTPTPSAESV